MLLSMQRLRQILGLLWLIDGLFQLQPQMFTSNMINGVMVPIAEGQPGPLASNLHWIITVVTQNLVLVNWVIAVVQILLGLLLITGIGVRATVIASIVWALIVWYGGEGMSLLFTGQSSVLSGAPGAVLLYPLIGLAVYPRTGQPDDATDGLLSRKHLRWVLAGFWIFAALLQLQSIWWQPEQISQAIGGMVGQGGLNAFLVDPVLQAIARATVNAEIPLNVTLIVVFLALGVALAVVKTRQVRPFLIVSLVLSLLIWYIAQGFGMIFTGMATDFNSGLLLVVMALGCWPGAAALQDADRPRTRFARDLRQQAREAGSAQSV